MKLGKCGDSEWLMCDYLCNFIHMVVASRDAEPEVYPQKTEVDDATEDVEESAKKDWPPRAAFEKIKMCSATIWLFLKNKSIFAEIYLIIFIIFKWPIRCYITDSTWLELKLT